MSMWKGITQVSRKRGTAERGDGRVTVQLNGSKKTSANLMGYTTAIDRGTTRGGCRYEEKKGLGKEGG